MQRLHHPSALALPEECGHERGSRADGTAWNDASNERPIEKESKQLISNNGASNSGHEADMIEAQATSSVVEWGDGGQQKWVIYSSSPFRRAWGMVMLAAVIYTATIMPYRLCFKEFKIPEAETKEPIGWIVIKWCVDVAFLADLCLQFFFTFVDPKSGREEDDQCKIACRYLKSEFIIDAVATFVPTMVSLAVDDGGDAVSGARLARLPRIVRLMRLSRLMQFRKVEACMKASFFSKTLSRVKSSRIIGCTMGLLLCVHLFACGWYLCAALHGDNWEETWLAARAVNSAGLWVGHADSGTQWIHSMYFVLTVFTTVGFGDIGPRTRAEITYAFFLMMVGAVVDSIIVSNMISILTSIDEASASFVIRTQLVEAFANHTKLDLDTLRQLRSWLHVRHKETSGFDSKMMRQLLLDAGGVPRELLGILPGALFRGAMVRSAFVQVCLMCNPRRLLPPRFALLIALELSEHRYQHNEVVYHAHDHAFNLFMVTEGTFAYIAQPTPAGGQTEVLRAPVTPKENPLTPRSPQSAFIQRNVFGFAPDFRSDSHAKLCVIPGRNHLFPFQLFSSRSYCGDIELFSGETRQSSLRSESPGEGVMLVMSKIELANLRHEFPHCKRIWYSESMRRAQYRQHLFEGMKEAREYKALAATTLQIQFRHYLKQKRQGQVAMSSNGAWNKGEVPKAGNERTFACLNQNQLTAANWRPGSAKHDLEAVHRKVNEQGKQLQTAMKGIDSLLRH